MSDNHPPNCEACGSSRVISGRLEAGGAVSFELPEYHWGTWFTWTNVPREIPIRQEKVKLCLDCGRVTASLSVDVEEARRVLNKWGSDALIARLGTGDRGT